MSATRSPPPKYRVRIAPRPDGSGSSGPPDLSPREALERWLDKLRVSKAESTVSAYHYRLKHFVEWCEAQDITAVGELNGWLLDSYETHRQGEGLEAISLNNEMGTLRSFLEYCESIEQVDEAIPKKVNPPSVPKGAGVSETRLTTEDAKELLEYYRTNPEARYTRAHALLEVAWHTAARAGGIRGLDLENYHSDEQYLEFRHRKDEGSPLKNRIDGQRVVGLSDAVSDALDGYIEQARHDVYDEYGREPLFTTTQGRMSDNAIRGYMYLATIPCLHGECPHGKDPDTCEYIDYGQASKCPSSRSPHQVRTGSITWHLNCGWDIADVAERVNASVRTIKTHYDKENRRAEMEIRRREHVDSLGFDEEEGGDE